MTRFLYVMLVAIFVICSNMACGDNKHVEVSDYKYYEPLYDGVKLVTSTDTLHFPLKNVTNKGVESIDPFSDHGVEYIAIYYGQSETVNFYELYSQKQVKSISIAGYLKYRKHKTSVYCKNFDSIFINNNTTSLFVIDSSGANKSTIYFTKSSLSTKPDFVNTRPPVLKDGYFYISFFASPETRTISKVRDWQLICRLDLKNNKKKNIYHLSERYMNNFYDYYFLNYSYCYNDRGNFVFSFSADSNLYETDLEGVNIALYGKSQFQQGDVEPVDKNAKGYDLYTEYMARDCYGSIFFDSFHKRYLRLFRKRISRQDIEANKYPKIKSVLVFNKDLQIIGESPLPSGFLINTLFFTSDGQMYARTKEDDKTTLHLLRIMYTEK